MKTFKDFITENNQPAKRPQRNGNKISDWEEFIIKKLEWYARDNKKWVGELSDEFHTKAAQNAVDKLQKQGKIILTTTESRSAGPEIVRGKHVGWGNFSTSRNFVMELKKL